MLQILLNLPLKLGLGPELYVYFIIIDMRIKNYGINLILYVSLISIAITFKFR